MATRPSISELRQPFVGRWRIVGADCYDRDYLDLVSEACLIVPPEGFGDMKFGAQTASLDLSSAPGMLVFEFHGSDEGDEISGEGFMELTGDDEGEIELDYHSGDFVVMKAVRVGKS